MVQTLVTLVLGILRGQGHEADRAGSNPSSITARVTQESGAQSLTATTWRFCISPVLITVHDKPLKNSLITTIIITTTILLLFFCIPKLRAKAIINSTLKFLWNVLFSKSSVVSLRSWLQFNLK